MLLLQIYLSTFTHRGNLLLHQVAPCNPPALYNKTLSLRTPLVHSFHQSEQTLTHCLRSSLLPWRTSDEFDDGLLFFYGGVLLLIVVAKHNRAEMLNSNNITANGPNVQVLKYYRYDPPVAAAIFFKILFFSTAMVHHQIVRTRT